MLIQLVLDDMGKLRGMEMGMPNIVEVKNLNAAYGQSKVLFDISLQIKPNERVAIVGRNGAGKTTLLKCMASLLTPDQWFRGL